MRILHVIDHFCPLLGYQETFLAKFHSLKHEVLVVTSNRYSRAMYEANRNLLKRRIIGSGLFIEEGIKVLRLPVLFELFEKPWLKGLEGAVINFNPDILIMHGLVNFTSIRIAKLKRRLIKMKLIIDDHMTYNATRGSWTKFFYYFFKTIFTPMFISTVDGFVAVTNETKEFMQSVYGIPDDRITIVPLGVDTSRFRYDSFARKCIRKEYGIGDNHVVFIYAGKVIPGKGVHLFIDAGLKLSKKFDNVAFLIVGGRNPEYFDYLQKIIAKADMRDRFIFVDGVPNSQLYKYYSVADVGVWPLQCSMTMLEAAACGLPIIISDKSGALERISKGNGVSYKQGDVNDLERKMLLLLDSELRDRMREKAYEYVKSIDWKTIADKFLEIVG
ncbi:MAG: glycosyltransferase family 4 protein [Candidatus Methanomethylicia archaeon]